MRNLSPNCGALDKFRQTVAGNKLLFSSLVAVMLAVVAGLTIVSVALARERQLQRATEVARAKTEIELRQSQETTSFLEEMLRSVQPSVSHGKDNTVFNKILAQAVDRLDGDLTNQPAMEVKMRSLIGRVYQGLEEYEQAEKMHRAALALNQKLHGPDSPETAASLNDLGLTLWNEGNLAEAGIALEEALNIRRQLFGNANSDVAASLDNLATVYRGQRRLTEADTLVRESLGVREKLFGKESPEAADSLYHLSILLNDEGKHSESDETAAAVLAIRKKLAGSENASGPSADDSSWAASLNVKTDDAKSLVLTALTIQRKVLGDEDPAVAKTLSSYGELLRQRGNLAESESILNAALSVQRKQLDTNSPDILDTLRRLARTFQGEGKWAEAEMTEREALSSWRRWARSDNPEMANELQGFVEALIAQKKFDEAEQILGEALTPEFVRRPASVSLVAKRLDVLGHRGRWRQAAEDAVLAVKLDPSDPYRYHVLAVLLAINHDRPAYEQLCQKILATFASMTEAFADERMAADCLLLPHSGADLQVVAKLADRAVTAAKGDDFALPLFQPCKAMSEYRLGRYGEAIEWAERSQTNSQPYEQAQACSVLAMACWQLGQTDKAQAALAKGLNLTADFFPVRDNEDIGNDWVLWLIARIQLEEAAALIQVAPAGTATAKSQ